MRYVPKEIQEEVNFTQIHPLKHFVQVTGVILVSGAILYGVTGLIADQMAMHLDPAVEKSIGQTFSSTIPQPKSETEAKTQVYLQTLITQLQQPSLMSRPTVQVYVLETKTVNAAALPGGEIIVTTGLLKFVKTENELALVLAHELGHHHFRHPIRRLGRSLLWTTVLSVLGLGDQNSMLLNQALPGLSSMTDLHFSRSQELEADRYALAALVRHYHHGGHALDFLHRLSTLEEGGVPQHLNLEIVSTHPNLENRVQQLEAIALDQGWSLTGTATPLSSPW